MAVSIKEKLIFTKNISVMIKAGIALGEALKLEASQHKNPIFRKALFGIAGEVSRGERFSGALSKHPAIFDSLYVNIIQTAEQSGSLDQSMEYVFEEMEDRLNFQRELTSALLYPAIIFSLVLVVGGGMAFFILPRLADTLSSFGGEPVWSVKVILTISGFVQNFGIAAVIVLILFLIGVYFLYQAKMFKSFFDRLLLSLPIFGGIFTKVYLARFAKVFSILLRSNIPMNRSLEISAGSLDNSIFKRSVLGMITHANQGSPISVYLDKKLFPALFIEMMQVGEKAGKIEHNLNYLSDFYKKEAKQNIANILTMLEPVLLLVIGAVILFLALAMFAPLYQTINSF
ncbi:MAG: type II secretion system F family protein [Patescibacteria group bacterium]